MPRDLEPYGIFRKLPDGSPIWVGAETDLQRALQRMRELANADAMEYFVHDFRTGVSTPLNPLSKDKPTDS